MRRAVVGCLMLLGALWVLGGSARAVTVGAGSASLVVLGRSGPLVKDASGSYYTTDVKLVLITPPPTKGAADTIAIWVTGGASRACRIGLSTDHITPRVPTTVTFTLLPSCLTSSSQGGGSITVHAGAAGAPVAAAVDVALGAVQPEPVQGQAHWWYLWLMAATVVGGSLLVLGATLYARRIHKTAMPKHWLRAPLEGLDTGWSFKDSWAANLTFLGTFATGIFAASDVLKAVLGSSPDQALAVMTVAGVIAAGMVGAGALLTSTFTNQGSPVTVAVLGAAAITLGGASGQLLVIGLEASTFNLGAWAWILMAP
ncbi:MAG TPA: hypothetical protein VFH70_09125, partial [Acidimicrobiales bacterium]|nr:hypothetical protein [Acidimicrobiales bacterium]